MEPNADILSLMITCMVVKSGNDVWTLGTYGGQIVEAHYLNTSNEIEITNLLADSGLNVSKPINHFDLLHKFKPITSVTIQTTHVIIYPYQEAICLSEFICNEPKIAAIVRNKIIIKVTEQVRMMHKVGIIHANLSTDNICILFIGCDIKVIIKRFEYAFSVDERFPPIDCLIKLNKKDASVLTVKRDIDKLTCIFSKLGAKYKIRPQSLDELLAYY